MRELFILIAHLLVTLAKLARPGGLGAVAAESLAVKHQLLIMKRAQRRAPKLTSWDRLVLGVCALFVSPKRPQRPPNQKGGSGAGRATHPGQLAARMRVGGGGGGGTEGPR